MRKLYRKIRTSRGAIRFVPLVTAQGRAIKDVATARHFTRARDAQQFADQALARRAEQIVEIISKSDALSEAEKASSNDQ